MVVLLAVAFVPQATSAGPSQEKSSREQREDVRERRGEVSGELDVLEVESDELIAALTALETQVANQAAELDEAERAAEAAEADLRDAEKAVAEAEWRIAELDAAMDEFVVEAYVNPPSEDVFDAFSAETISDAAIKRVLLDLQSNTDADLLDQLEMAHEDLDLERANREDIAAEAEAKRQAAVAKLEELQAAVAEQEAFAAEAEQALERKLAEAATLDERDKELADQIRREDEALRELARQLEAQRQREEEARRQREAAEAAAASGGGSSGGGSSGGGSSAGSGGASSDGGSSGGGSSGSSGGSSGGGGSAPAPSQVSPAPGGLATVSCPGGGSITVAGSIASNLRNLLDHAARDGLSLCGWGYRDSQRQIELRSINGCPDVYTAPASSCRVPTARPGQSMHERGLAVDFENCSTRSTSCYQWLNRHASSYGLYNLPSEPWHWSTNGR